ncbi:MAG: hypothetical protein JXR91_09880 [Deltaproteobacteria bacterium]|nr:hypothetical protein [Deltaproteobacteria bacterium]
MKKMILGFITLLMVMAFAACSEDEPATATQDEVAQADCDKMDVCKNPLFDQLGDNCVTMIKASLFNQCEAYDEELGASCIDDATAMDCDSFNAAVSLATSGDYSGFPKSCETICGSK